LVYQIADVWIIGLYTHPDGPAATKERTARSLFEYATNVGQAYFAGEECPNFTCITKTPGAPPLAEPAQLKKIPF
jgi:hypothetical protein